MCVYLVAYNETTYKREKLFALYVNILLLWGDLRLISYF